MDPLETKTPSSDDSILLFIKHDILRYFVYLKQVNFEVIKKTSQRATGDNNRFLFQSTVYGVTRVSSETWEEPGLRAHPPLFPCNVLLIRYSL